MSGVMPSRRTMFTPPMWPDAHVSVIFWWRMSVDRGGGDSLKHDSGHPEGAPARTRVMKLRCNNLLRLLVFYFLNNSFANRCLLIGGLALLPLTQGCPPKCPNLAFSTNIFGPQEKNKLTTRAAGPPLLCSTCVEYDYYLIGLLLLLYFETY